MSAQPPHPIPPHLRPLRASLGEGDLCLVLRGDELEALRTAIALDVGHTYTLMRIVHRDGSPWIECDVVVPPMEPPPHAIELELRRFADSARSYALWRYTCAVYRVGPDGAVEDDPMYTPDDRSHPA